ncbi:MAG: peptide deformylase [Armatimonadetes bacterium]|nr:peptide deformylase [Armatimonadota bacterium]MCX7968152.1 peptide deformylase [Armatimonadota bacterium]MDW8142038.1 peptide deformylase [Armatimonadota bacterium]
MAVRKIVTIGNPILRQKASPVGKITKAEKQIIDDMFETMGVNEGVGLAAPQIGIPKRIIVAQWEGEKYAIVNPKIEWRSDEMVIGTEGCLSIPGVQANVNRHLKIRVRGVDGEGKTVILEPEGWLARIFQHEIDHLDGILIIDRSDELFWIVTEEDESGRERTRLVPTTKSAIIAAFQKHKAPARR